MPLPDASRLLSTPEPLWRALGARLRAIGMTAENVHPIDGVGTRYPHAAAAPLRAWHARRIGAPWAAAMRLFMLGDPLSDDEARATLGDVPLGALCDAGLLVRADGGGLVSPFPWSIVRDLYVICDDLRHRGDAVMGSSATTHALCRAATGEGRVGGRALDVGCGAGTLALLLAREHDAVVGTDISPRAIVLARANARLNGIANADFREGDLFAPVAGERFDVIVSQPPFVSMPDGFDPAPYLYGGPNGDELALRLLRELGPHLSEKGRATVLVAWPRIGEVPVSDRVRAALGDGGISALLLEGPPADLDEHCIGYAIVPHPELGPSYAREVVRRREHLAARGIEDLRLTLNVLARATPGKAFTSVVPVAGFAEAPPVRARIDRMLAAHALVASGQDALLDARVRVPPGTTFEPDGASVLARAPREALVEPLRIAPTTHRLLTMLDGAASVRELLSQIALLTSEDEARVIEHLAPTVATALRCGLLELA